MKKKFLFLIIIISIVLAGCSKKAEYMDRAADDGQFYYSNKDLNFSLVLPPEFLYYQTQRVQTGDYIDIEFFVPTADRAYPQEVPGYAKPVVLRIFINGSWGKIEENSQAGSIYKKVGEKNNNIYTVKFWEKVPADWTDKWAEDLKQKIIDNFKLI